MDDKPIDQEITELKQRLASIKAQVEKKAEYEQLKADLETITQKAVNTPNEFEGAMSMPDTDNLLTTKRKTHHFFDKLIERFLAMLSPLPIMGSIIALIIFSLAVFYIYNEVDAAWFIKYRAYFSYGAQFAGALVILKSSTRSLLLPLICLLTGGIVAHSINEHQTLLYMTRNFYEGMMVIGIIGSLIAVIKIN